MFFNHHFFSKALLIVLLFSFIHVKSQGQNSLNKNKTSPSVRWIKQFPIPKNEKKSLSIFNKIGKFFFGKPQIFLNKPIAVIAIDPDTLWILDQGNQRVLSLVNKKLESPSFVSKIKYRFPSLIGSALMSKKEILFTDSRLNQLFLINTDNKTLVMLNDSVKLKQPTGVAYSKNKKEIWVVETAAHQISILNKKGELVKTVGRRGTKSGEFNFPTFIWIDKTDHVYVVDAMNFRVQIFDIDGNYMSSFGEIGDVSGTFSRPKGIATDSFGNIYVVDALFHVVQIFDSSGNFLYSFGGQGRGKGQFWMPIGIYIDDENYIYISDSYNSKIQVFQLINGY